jgi:ribonuclease-3
MDTDPYSPLERRLGVVFRKKEMLESALVHSSAKSEDHPSNERLEFLGDSVIGLVVSHFLFTAFPDRDEGELTRLKSVIVSEAALAHEASRLGLDEDLLLGRGLPRASLPSSILANAFEAIVGALFLDSGVEAVRRFVLLQLSDSMERAVGCHHARNWKSLLQQFTQRLFAVTPTYKIKNSSGPEHVKEFEVVALISSMERGQGRGRSKKDAEQEAARGALADLLGVDSSLSDHELETHMRLVSKDERAQARAAPQVRPGPSLREPGLDDSVSAAPQVRPGPSLG